MKTLKFLLVPALALVLFLPCARARIDLTTLTDQDQIQTTIYNDADLTLVRDSRTLNFTRGLNLIRFSWANTRIDPTSLALEIRDPALPVRVREMSFPPDARDLGIWHIQADKACRAGVDITYFTSGITWQASYTAFLSGDETRMKLAGYIRVENQSGEDYPDAQTRVVVGKINLLDRIADLAQRPYPYGRPERIGSDLAIRKAYAKGVKVLESSPVPALMADARPKEILKQGVSEYFVYTIEGRETISHGWAKRLLSFKADQVPVENIFLYDKKRYGDRVIRKLFFANESKAGLGTAPLPAGEVKVFKTMGKQGDLTFLGSTRTKYTPMGRTSELLLGPSARVTVKPVVMGFARKNIIFDSKANISGLDEVREMEIRMANFSHGPARVEIVRNQPSPHFKVDRVQGSGKFEKIDQNRFRFRAELAPGAKETIQYRLTTFTGERRWQQ
ncbi:DUF4139 domain-containing protein [Desulfospira joergensenii]|uniref:DUF4139 domain-containing protein n=1 Tax=Desulfospira joergensenii TaxID=53329 RepID=UPI0003B76F0A|nr:hypothetical protein [Desulfospira joergensenii]